MNETVRTAIRFLCPYESMGDSMTLWRVEVYDDVEDSTPAKVGFVHADTETAAADAVERAVAGGIIAGATIVSHAASAFPPLRVLWVPASEAKDTR